MSWSLGDALNIHEPWSDIIHFALGAISSVYFWDYRIYLVPAFVLYQITTSKTRKEWIQDSAVFAAGFGMGQLATGRGRWGI